MNQDYKKMFGLEFRTERMKTPDLPIYMTAGRKFCRLSNEACSFILVTIPENERFGVVAFEKQITRASEQLAAMHLISQEMKGKEYYMTLQGAGTVVKNA